MPHRAVRPAIAAVLALAVLFLAVPVHAQPGGTPHEVVNGREAAAREVLVKFRHTTPVAISQVFQQEDVDTLEEIGAGGVFRLLSRSKNVLGLLRSLVARGDVEYVEPNYIVHTLAPQVPNDTSFSALWGLHNTGQSIGGVAGIAGVDINAADAWGVTTGSAAHVVGVIDTGVNYNHADLSANMWSAPTAFSVTVGGVVITCAQGTRGFNAILNTCDPMDDNNHGTHVAGTIGATGNNTAGVAGVNWTASMMGLKFLGANGSGNTSNAVKAIDFAIQVKQLGLANVRVLSNSWGGGGFSQTLLDAIRRANTTGILFVAAAGNAASNTDVTPAYPAGYDVANVISVAATDNRDNLASFSNYGAVTVDLGAPGVNVLSTTIGGYSYYSGTSMATPHVSGAAALVLAACADLSTADLVSTLLDSVDPVASLAGKTYTGGRLNVFQAIQSCASAPTPTPDFSVSASPTPQSITTGQNASFTVSTQSVNGFSTTVVLSVSGVPSGATATFDQPSVTAGVSSTLTVTKAPAGTHVLTITGNSNGTERTTTVTLVVTAPVVGSFTVGASPASKTVTVSGSTTYSLTIGAQNGFAGVVSLSVEGLPAGATESFNPASVTGSGTSTLTIATSGSTPQGTYPLTLKGTNSSVGPVHANVTLVVQCKAKGKCR